MTSLLAYAGGPAAPITYPDTKKIDHADDYNGVKVQDPYHWLEDANSAETKQWVEEENKVTFDYLDKLPARDAIRKRLTELWNYERYSSPWSGFQAPFKRGGRYFYFKNDGLQNQSVLYTMKSLKEEPKVLIDPNKLSPDGTVALSGIEISQDGKYIAWGVQVSGSDWQEWKVRDIDIGQDTSDKIEYVKFSGMSFTKDGKQLYYSRYDKPDENTKLQASNFFHKVYVHTLGQPQSEDKLVYEDKQNKERLHFAQTTDDGRYLILTINEGSSGHNRVHYKDLTKPDSSFVPLLDKNEAHYNFIDNDGGVFYFVTDNGAPHYRMVAIDTAKPDPSAWKTVIPESKDTLQNVSYLNNTFVADYLKDAHSAVRIYDHNGKVVRDIQFPGIGSAGGFGGTKDDKETFYSFTQFTQPTTLYHLDLTTGKSEVFKQPKLAYNPADYETKQVFYPSKDGTKVPMFLVYKKGLKLDGNNPTYLYAYGGFNISSTPGFSPANLTWMEMGGLYAMANLRGGGEYGKEWHEAGMREKKQNVFDDFIAAAEWLISNKYTSHDKISAGGRSNGGLLIGAVMTQRPDLFKAVLPGVGVMDMLRFNKFTIGWAWMDEYGNPDKADDFKFIRAYSPLHNIKPGTKYPATLVTTADHDDRVVPAHSFKFISTLQAAQGGDAPVLIRIDTKSGHGGGKPTTKLIDEWTDLWGFLAYQLGMDVNGKMAQK